MDYRVFLVRPAGTGGRAVKGTTRILRVLDNRILLSPVLPSINGTATEYSYERISNVLPSLEDELELKFDVLNNSGRGETLKFSCDSRSALLTALLNKLDDVDSSGIDFPLKKHSHQRGGLVDTVLRVRSTSIVKMISTGIRNERRKINPAKKLNLLDILKVEILTDDEHVVLLYFKSRIMRLSLKDISPFLQSIQQNMKRFLNKDIEILKITSSVMVDNISAFVRKTGTYPVLYSFQALKKIDSRKEERPRNVSITKEHLVERSGDEVTSLYSLADVVGIVIKEDGSREVVIEFKSCRPAQYTLEARDDFLACMADVMESLKLLSFSIHVEGFLPHMFPEKPPVLYQNECEQYYLNQILAITDVNDHNSLHQLLKEYACNINSVHWFFGLRFHFHFFDFDLRLLTRTRPASFLLFHRCSLQSTALFGMRCSFRFLRLRLFGSMAAASAPVLGTTQDAPRPVTWTYELTEEDEVEMQTAIEHFSGRTLVGRLVGTTPSRPTAREWIESALGGSTGRILELSMMGAGLFLVQLSDSVSTDGEKGYESFFGYRMDGNKEEGSFSEDRQPISIAHEIGESSGQAEKALQVVTAVTMFGQLMENPRFMEFIQSSSIAHQVQGSFGMPGTVFRGMQGMVPNPMYANIGLHPGFQGTQGHFGVSQGNVGMAGFFIPPVNMTPRHQHVTGQGV
ncbi:hypothetical protein L7F22_018797 [Adiantum nelumboides]|nr:hypothetical protein [Adiantum nelumboides]